MIHSKHKPKAALDISTTPTSKRIESLQEKPQYLVSKPWFRIGEWNKRHVASQITVFANWITMFATNNNAASWVSVFFYHLNRSTCAIVKSTICPFVLWWKQLALRKFHNFQPASHAIGPKRGARLLTGQVDLESGTWPSSNGLYESWTPSCRLYMKSSGKCHGDEFDIV